MLYLVFFVFGAAAASIASHYIHVAVFKEELQAAKNRAVYFEDKFRAEASVRLAKVGAAVRKRI